MLLFSILEDSINLNYEKIYIPNRVNNFYF